MNKALGLLSQVLNKVDQNSSSNAGGYVVQDNDKIKADVDALVERLNPASATTSNAASNFYENEVTESMQNLLHAIEVRRKSETTIENNGSGLERPRNQTTMVDLITLIQNKVEDLMLEQKISPPSNSNG